MDRSALLRYVFSPWVVGGAIALALALLCASLFALWITRPAQTTPAPATAVLNVIPLPNPSPTSIPPTPSPTPTQIMAESLPPPASDIVLGALVQVSGTGGDGLRLRAQPGLNSQVLFLGLESEVFEVRDGPRQADGYTWWLLVAPYDPTVSGWAVSNYLRVVQNP